ncbi:anthranilate phosphoribosyltransferase [Aurantivibrio plasticivorans]
MSIQNTIAKVVDGHDLSTDEMIAAMRLIMTGEATPAQIGGFLVALKIKGETIEEIAGAAQVMRELSSKVEIDVPNMVDTCGTGGDGSNLFNVSTAGAFVVAAAGGHVAKHGNRSITSSTGSADVLETAGVNLDLTPEQVAKCIAEVGVGFMFAVKHHGAMKHAIGPRKELGLRTIFNVLGPMTNPAGVKRQVIGVYDQSLCEPIAKALQQLGSEHVMVVHASDGLDEFTLAGETFVAELKDGLVTTYTIKPEDVGIETQSLDGLSVSSSDESLALIRGALSRQGTDISNKAADIIAYNAGAAIYVSGLSDDFKTGVALAQDAIGSGLALGKLTELVEMSSCF